MCETCGCNITPGNEHLARQKNPQGQDAVSVLKSLLSANDREAVHNQAELILAKQRHGPTGTTKLYFEAEFTRFADLDPHHASAD